MLLYGKVQGGDDSVMPDEITPRIWQQCERLDPRFVLPLRNDHTLVYSTVQLKSTYKETGKTGATMAALIANAVEKRVMQSVSHSIK